jgi:hypothetical protein
MLSNFVATSRSLLIEFSSGPKITKGSLGALDTTFVNQKMRSQAP